VQPSRNVNLLEGFGLRFGSLLTRVLVIKVEYKMSCVCSNFLPTPFYSQKGYHMLLLTYEKYY